MVRRPWQYLQKRSGEQRQLHLIWPHTKRWLYISSCFQKEIHHGTFSTPGGKRDGKCITQFLVSDTGKLTSQAQGKDQSHRSKMWIQQAPPQRHSTSPRGGVTVRGEGFQDTGQLGNAWLTCTSLQRPASEAKGLVHNPDSVKRS